LPAWLAADANRVRGEFVLVLHPAPPAVETGTDTRVLELLLAELPLKSAVRLAAEITGQSRNALYDAALALKRGGGAGGMLALRSILPVEARRCSL
jgi:16S rRNA (cytidine1402-2'-O)-methyltransferase